MSRWVLGLVALAAASSCEESRSRQTRLQSFRVTLKSEAGTPEAPLPFVVRESRDFVIDVEAVDSTGALISDFNGLIQVSVVPGSVTGLTPSEPVVSGGVLRDLRVSVRGAFGSATIWVEDRSGTNFAALGASPKIYFENPRIRDIQQPAPGQTRDSSPLAGSVVLVDRGDNVVVHVANDGFYVVDKSETLGYASAFGYNFNRPEGLRRGDKLFSFGGSVMEFLGYTELGFPQWEVDRRCPTAENPRRLCEDGEWCIDGECLSQICGERLCAEGSVCRNEACVPNTLIPDPVQDPPALIAAEMEKYEAGLVRFNNVITTQEFRACDDPSVNPGANGNGVCEFCRTCNANRNVNGTCPAGGRCCPVGQLCNTRAGEGGQCTSPCNANRDAEGKCPVGRTCCPAGAPPGSVCDEAAGMCGGCTEAELQEAACEDECARRRPTSPGGICTSLCDYREFGQYRIGLTTNGQWNGATVLMVTTDTVPSFRADAPENRGKRLDSVTGVLRNIFAPGPLWIVQPRDECDIKGITRTRTDCDTVK